MAKHRETLITKRRSTARTLKQRYDAEHRKGMKALADGDLAKVSEVIANERAIIEEQQKLIYERMNDRGRPVEKTKATKRNR